MKKILAYCLLCLPLLSLGFIVHAAGSAQSLLQVTSVGDNYSASNNAEVTFKDGFLKTIQVYLIAAYVIVAIGLLIYIGFKLFSAQGDEGEFKKAWIALVYVIIGMAIAPLAWIAVKIVTGFSF